MMTADERRRQQGIRRTLVRAIIGLIAMFAFAFALVPLYEVICEVTGLNGRSKSLVQEAEQSQIDEIVVDYDRTVKLQFVAINNKHVPWEFEPVVEEVELHPGEIKTYYYHAKNLTGKNMVTQSIPSVSPYEASSYLRKIECFCFANQPLAAGAETRLAVNLYVHHALPEEINTLTLAYSLFDITASSDFELLTTGQAGNDPSSPEQHEHDHN